MVAVELGPTETVNTPDMDGRAALGNVDVEVPTMTSAAVVLLLMTTTVVAPVLVEFKNTGPGARGIVCQSERKN